LVQCYKLWGDPNRVDLLGLIRFDSIRFDSSTGFAVAVCYEAQPPKFESRCSFAVLSSECVMVNQKESVIGLVNARGASFCYLTGTE
jgi:hypothetical protein